MITKIEKGDHIVIEGVHLNPGRHEGIVGAAYDESVGEVEDWTVEFDCERCHQYHSWVQRDDGGEIILVEAPPKKESIETRDFQVGVESIEEEPGMSFTAQFSIDVSDLRYMEADELAVSIARRIAKAHHCQVRWNRGPVLRGFGQGHYVGPDGEIP